MSDVQRPLPPKKDVALALLEREPSVFIHLDPRRPGVSVPKWFTGQPQLILQVGLNMAIPIPDLRVDDEGISCTLSFNRVPFWCRLPWHAIWALVSEDQRGMVWPEDIPADFPGPKQQRPGASSPQKPAKRPRPRLAAVAPSGDDEPSAEAARARTPGARRPEGEPDAEAGARGAGEAPARDASAPVRPLSPVPAPALAPVRSGDEVEDDESGSSGEPGPQRRGSGKPKRELPPYLRVIK
ncbi:ClpXP protease specificity-enhancing factor SspB [Sorangium sp. So ce1036]|uniref:ClpXP protease specificity-enhancing factor SspB n=1 Tax=Sorangium sp. So ce1036 TaxID=3133328 RepID=UPI003F09D054